ncbi:hypothetical protein Nepgr_001815 [Nepenthes gracilis]|uniref:Uncharacterized protein n=1 Tax=Nepenthes gracilis TaxID=150966 RepID=A0AAD3RXS4_NEPGR|nr:hypothetical protein Nepgr_001815 [Nepenthes gracilis]
MKKVSHDFMNTMHIEAVSVISANADALVKLVFEVQIRVVELKVNPYDIIALSSKNRNVNEFMTLPAAAKLCGVVSYC